MFDRQHTKIWISGPRNTLAQANGRARGNRSVTGANNNGTRNAIPVVAPHGNQESAWWRAAVHGPLKQRLRHENPLHAAVQ